MTAKPVEIVTIPEIQPKPMVETARVDPQNVETTGTSVPIVTKPKTNKSMEIPRDLPTKSTVLVLLSPGKMRIDCLGKTQHRQKIRKTM